MLPNPMRYCADQAVLPWRPALPRSPSISQCSSQALPLEDSAGLKVDAMVPGAICLSSGQMVHLWRSLEVGN